MPIAIHVTSPKFLYPELEVFAKSLIFEVVDAPEFHATTSVDADVMLSPTASVHCTHITELLKLIGNATSLYVELIVNDVLPHCLSAYDKISRGTGCCPV